LFVFSLSAGFEHGVSHAARARTLLDGFPLTPADGVREAACPRAAAGVGRWVVSRRDAHVEPTWDADARVLFAGDVRLYNRPEVATELGVPAAERDCSDLELARRAFLRWRQDTPGHLVGDFAFAAWDEGTGTLFAARDQIGMRPLYFQVLPDGIVVASDVRQMHALRGPTFADLDPRRLLDWCAGLGGDVRRTYFRNIHRLRPGHVLIGDARGVDERRYWLPPPVPASPRSYDENCARLREIFARCVRDRLDSDRPIVAHSSGGFDSSTILVAADRVYRHEPGRPPLLMVSGITPGFACDESGYMDAVAAAVTFQGRRWNIVDETPTTFPGVSRAGPVLRRGLAGGGRRDLEIAHEIGARVLLTGIGGDDVWFAHGVLRDFVRHGRLITAVGDAFRGSQGLGGVRRLLDAGWGLLPPATAARLAGRLSPRPAPPEWLGPALRAAYAVADDPPEILDVDWPSHLYHSLWAQLTHPQASAVIEAMVEHGLDDAIEVRAPCLDVRLIDHMLSIPWQQRQPRGHFRRTGRDALGPMLPPVFRGRSGQQGWGAVVEAAALRVIPALAPFIDSGPWLSAPFIDRGIARAMLRDLLANGTRTAPETCLIVPEIGALEAWLRDLFL